MVKAKTKIVILGGGFAGIKALHELYKRDDVDITLITDQETFRYGATIWRATTGYLKETSYIPIDSLIPKANNVHLVIDSAVSIDREKRTIKTTRGSHEYDYCIIGLGVVTSYSGISGLEEYSYSIKSSEGFDAFRKHLHQELLDTNALDKNYVVVGAGPTGVELAAALRSYLKTVAKHHKLKRSSVSMKLVEAAPRVLPTMLAKASKTTRKRLVKLGVSVMTKQAVEGETKQTLKVGKQSIPTQTVIWTAGVTCNPFFTNNPDQFTLNEKKRVVVDGHLQVDEHVFVLGDSAATPYSGLALTALHNAKFVARVISNSLDGYYTRSYQPLKPLTIIPVGHNWAVLQWRSLVLSGRMVSWMRTVYDFVGYTEIVGLKQAYRIWLKRNQRHEDCPDCQETTAS